MGPGDRVKHRGSGKVAKILRIDGDKAIVDMPDGETPWALVQCRPTGQIVSPRGVASVNDTMRAAARQIEEGTMTRPAAEKFYRVTKTQLQSWIDAVRAEREDRRNLESVRRTG